MDRMLQFSGLSQSGGSSAYIIDSDWHLASFTKLTAFALLYIIILVTILRY